MGRLVIPIGVNIGAVEKVFGSKDEQLIKSLLASNCYKTYDEEYSFKKELYDILFNYIPVENRIVQPAKLFGLIKGNDGRGLEGDWNDYGYALLTICSCLGERFSEDCKEFVYDDNWWKINTLLRESGCLLDLSRMHETKQIFDTPFEKTDIYTSCYTNEEVRELNKFFSNSEIHESDLYNSLKHGLKYCEERNLDIMIFSFEN